MYRSEEKIYQKNCMILHCKNAEMVILFFFNKFGSFFTSEEMKKVKNKFSKMQKFGPEYR